MRKLNRRAIFLSREPPERAVFPPQGARARVRSLAAMIARKDQKYAPPIGRTDGFTALSPAREAFVGFMVNFCNFVIASSPTSYSHGIYVRAFCLCAATRTSLYTRYIYYTCIYPTRKVVVRVVCVCVYRKIGASYNSRDYLQAAQSY